MRRRRPRSSNQSETPAAESSARASSPCRPPRARRHGTGGREGEELGARTASSRSRPWTAEVTVLVPAARTPRMRHAQVLGLHHDAHPARREVGLQPVRHLLGQALLDLRAAREHLDDPRQLGQAEDAFPGQVPDVRHPDERQQVVLAHRLHRDGPGQHQLVVRPRRWGTWSGRTAAARTSPRTPAPCGPGWRACSRRPGTTREPTGTPQPPARRQPGRRVERSCSTRSGGTAARPEVARCSARRRSRRRPCRAAWRA